MTIIDPWGSNLIEDYNKIIQQFGLEIFDDNLFVNVNRVMRRKVVFAGRDLKKISECIKNKKPFYVLSGIMPSNDKIHFGNKIVIENIKYFQELGAKTYVCIADLEASAARGISLEEAKKRALNFHIPAYIALGLDVKKTIFYFQSENKIVNNLAFEFAKKITANEFKSIYGTIDPGRVMAALTQAADILFPQLNKKMPGIVPAGIDQDPHLRLTRDIARRFKEKYKFIPPSSMYHKYTPSLDGGLKMSKSKPENCLQIPEDEKKVEKKLKRALTGGKETLEEQKEKGGEPNKCMIFEMYKQHLIEKDEELNKVYDECKKGILLCGPDKKESIKKMIKFMDDLNKKIVEIRENIVKKNKLNFLK